MSQIAANPYINFSGRAREALEFYHEALGGELKLLAMNSEGVLAEAASEDRIMHGALTSDGLLIMGTDGHPDYPPTPGDNVAIALSGSDYDRLSSVVDVLSAGGKLKQALKTEVWGDTFGYFEDKFGVNWMVDIYPDKAAPTE